MPADDVEVRPMVPREICDVIDAVSIARGMNRTQMVNRILSEWARDQRHALMVLNRLTKGNPPEPDGGSA